MKKHNNFLFNLTFVLAILSTGLLLFNMLAILIWKKQIFFDRNTFSVVEVIILIGFGVILLFDIVSFIWVLLRLTWSDKVTTGNISILILGALCLLFFVGEKVMIDEIGREYILGWEVLGEFIILYVLLFIQLIYNTIILIKLSRIKSI